jgi:hypothetical protein
MTRTISQIEPNKTDNARSGCLLCRNRSEAVTAVPPIAAATASQRIRVAFPGEDRASTISDTTPTSEPAAIRRGRRRPRGRADAWRSSPHAAKTDSGVRIGIA